MTLDIAIRDPRGRLVYRYRQPSRSYVYNFLKALYALLLDVPNNPVTTIVVTSGASVDYPYLYSDIYPLIQVTSPANNLAYGMVFGSGTTPPTPDDYKLEAPLGTSVLDYGATLVDAPNKSATDMWFTISRSATNISSSTITISEVGLIARVYQNAAFWRYFLIIRDVLDTAINVAPGQTITATYTIIVSV